MAAYFFAFDQFAGRQRPIYRAKPNPLEGYSDFELIERYRFPREVIERLVNECNFEQPRNNRGRPVSDVSRVCAALRFYATGSFQRVTGDLGGMSQPTMSRALHDVTEALCRLSSNYISMPSGRDHRDVMRTFYDDCGIGGVIGAVDGTHIPIKAPAAGERHYVNRKQYHSINVQCIADRNLVIRDVVARWPGSTHDSYIWSNCATKDKLERGELQGILLGDSGYPLRSYLLTPVANPQTAAEERYNNAHSRGRVCVERCFGVLKNRFRCLSSSGGALEYSPGFVCQIMTACCVLHNIAITNKLPNPIQGPHDVPDDAVPHWEVNVEPAGRSLRNRVIQELSVGRLVLDVMHVGLHVHV